MLLSGSNLQTLHKLDFEYQNHKVPLSYPGPLCNGNVLNRKYRIIEKYSISAGLQIRGYTLNYFLQCISKPKHMLWVQKKEKKKDFCYVMGTQRTSSMR